MPEGISASLASSSKEMGAGQIVGGQETRVFGSEPSARDRLIGTWRLVSAEALRPDGLLQPFPELGPHPIGYLMYDKTGHMCVTLANPNPQHWEDPAKPSDSERALTHKSMEAYCGIYEVREKEGRVIHRPELGEWPYYIGSDQVRNFHIEGDRLILSLEETRPNGEKRRSQITWEKVSGSSKVCTSYQCRSFMMQGSSPHASRPLIDLCLTPH